MPSFPRVLAPCTSTAGTQELADELRAMTATHDTAVAQVCDICGTAYFPPLLMCRSCGSDELSWISCGDTGTVGTFVTVHTDQPTPSMSIPSRLLDQVPYTSVYLVPDEVPTIRIAALMTGDQQARLAVGMPVTFRSTGGRALVADLVAD